MNCVVNYYYDTEGHRHRQIVQIIMLSKIELNNEFSIIITI